MAITVKHKFVSSIPDGADTSVVRPSNWNDDHDLTGTIPVANGGTGASTADGAVTNLLPSQTGNNGKFLSTDGTNTSWSSPAGAGTVTSVAATAGTGISVTGSPITTNGTLNITNTAPDQTVVLTAGTGISTSGTYPNFTITNTSPSSGGTVTSVALTAPSIFTVTGSPITSSGTLALTYSGTALPVANGGTGASTLTGYVYGNGVSAMTASTTIPSTAVTGLGTMSTQNANAVAITGGTIDGTTIGGTTPAVITGSTINANTKVVSPDYYAQSILGGNLRTSGGTSLVNWDGGGSGNVTVNGGLLANPVNKNVSLAPTGTGSVTVNPATAGTMNNMVIGGTTPLAITGTTITAATFSGSGASLTSIPNSALVNSAITINGTSTSLGGSINVGTVTSVTGTSPVVSSGGATPAISMPAATTSVSGYLTSTDWNTFNGKGSGTVTSVAATVPAFLSVTGSPITSSGTLAIAYSGTALPILNGGTGATTASAAFNALSPLTTAGDTLYGGTSGAGTRLAIGTAGQVLTVNAGATAPQWSTVTGTGTVTTVSVASANGFAGTVANASTTPAITLTTSITGVLKGNATAISAAIAGTDYSAGTSALTTGILKSTTTTGALTIAVAADFPTLNQNTTGSAATLTTARAIYGNNFDGSAALTQVITGTYGGTGVNNGTNTITVAGNLTHAGAFTQSFTATANTAVTLPAGATASANNLLSSATAVGIVTGTPSSTTYLRGDGTWAAAGGSMTYPSGTGIAVVTSGTSWGTTLTAPSGTIVGTTDTQTLTNKTITARVSSTTSITSPLADNSDNFDLYAATAQAGALTISADAGTPTDGRKIQFRFTCDATPRVITFTGGASKGFKPVGVTMTASGSDFTYTLTASKTTYFGAIYNTSSARWEIVAISQEA